MAKVQEPLSDALLGMISDLAPEVRQAMALYRHHWLSDERWNQVREAALGLIPRSAPPTVEAFHKQMSALILFVRWTHESGYSLDPESMVTPERVETWREIEHLKIARGQSKFSKATVNGYVTRMRNMGPLINPSLPWPPKPGRVSGGVTKGLRDPYSDEEVARLHAQLETLPPGPRRDMGRALFALGLGVGLRPGEMAAITGNDIQVADDSVWVDVPGKHARRVPGIQQWAEPLRGMAREAGPKNVIMLTAKHKNAFGEACRVITLGRKSAALSPQRLRITWMVHRLRAGVDPRSLSAWAGLTSLTSVMELYRHLPEPDGAVQAALMRGNGRT